MLATRDTRASTSPDDRERFPFHDDDLTYRHLVTDVREESNAVVVCIMDTSGSMDTMKKYLARCFFFLLYQFIRSKYRNVEIVFIAHHTEAKEVTEDEFFHKGESGGTFISSGYQKALEIIAERYHPSLWNIYAFHCSDGDNFDSDNPAALRAAKELTDICNLFGYGEIKPLGSRYYESSMLNVFRRLDADNFQTVLIERKEDVWPSFKALLAKDRVRRARPRRDRRCRATTTSATSKRGTPASASRSRSSGSTATRRSSRSATTTRCSATWRTPACRRTTRTGRTASRSRS